MKSFTILLILATAISVMTATVVDANENTRVLGVSINQLSFSISI